MHQTHALITLNDTVRLRMIVWDCDVGGTWEGVEDALGKRPDQAIRWVRVTFTRSIDDVSAASQLGAGFGWGLTLLEVAVSLSGHGRDCSQGAEAGQKKGCRMHGEVSESKQPRWTN